MPLKSSRHNTLLSTANTSDFMTITVLPKDTLYYVLPFQIHQGDSSSFDIKYSHLKNEPPKKKKKNEPPSIQSLVNFHKPYLLNCLNSIDFLLEYWKVNIPYFKCLTAKYIELSMTIQTQPQQKCSFQLQLLNSA